MSISPERDLVQMPLAQAAVDAHGFTLWAGRDLPRASSDVIVTPWCVEQVSALNPELSLVQVRDAVRKLEAILAATSPANIVEHAKSFLSTLRTGPQIRVGSRKRSVKVIDFENPAANRWDIATEVTYNTSGGVRAVRFDVVVYANGIPLVVTECKSMIDPHASWLKAAKDITGAYTQRASAFLAAGLFQIATDGREVRYGAIKTAPQQFQRWGTTLEQRPPDDTFEQVVWDFLALTDPARLCAWGQDLVLHLSDRTTGVLTRYVPRWTQAEAAPLMADRALDSTCDRGLLVHFQGSGKTLAMLMATNSILRREPRHCVVLVVDRLDLLAQHRQEFAQSDARRSIHEAEDGQGLTTLLGAPATSGIIITTVHRFADRGLLSRRSDITVMVDEAHRTQGTGDAQLGGQMRTALPHATLLGLTGTPVAEDDRNTFDAFGSDRDPGRVLHRYNAADSVRDGTTVPLVIDRRRIVQTLQREELDAAFADYVKQEAISSTKAEKLAQATTRWDVLLKDPRRIDMIAENVAQDLIENVLPGEYGAMLVVADREATVLYAEKFKQLLRPDQVTAVISGTKNDPASFAPYVRNSTDESAVIRSFRDPSQSLKLLIVTSKLLTGFDAKNCSTIYIDKPLKGHTLFQAVTRVNRTWVTPQGTEKGFGIVVDYCGVAPEVLQSFDQAAEDTARKEILRPVELVAQFKLSLTGAEAVFGSEFDWKVPPNELLISAKRHLAQDAKLWRVFRQNLHHAELIFETLPNNPTVRAERQRLVRLVQIFDSYGTSAQTETEALVLAHGTAVRALVVAHTGDPTRLDLDLLSLGSAKIRELIGNPGDPAVEIQELQAGAVLEKLRDRLRARMDGPHAHAYSSIADKLEQFASTVYVATPEGVQQAALDLVELAKQLKSVDDIVGEQWERLDLELFGRHKHPESVLQPKAVLQQILDEYAPHPMPAGLDDVAEVLDDIVDNLSYKSLRDDVSAQKKLTSMVLRDCRRLGVLPTDKHAANEFVTQLVAYINAYLV